jgi:hypothetical protein
MTNEEKYVAMAQELAATKIRLMMAMKLLKKAGSFDQRREAIELWEMQLKGLLEEVAE